MIVALDGMGGDYAPRIPIEGALAALDSLEGDLRITITGPRDVLQKELESQGRGNEKRIEIVHAPDVIEMSESASNAIRKKPKSSLLVAVDLHQEDKAQAVISAGHTGAQMAASYLKLGLIKGVRRPTIGGLFPVGGGKFSILLDVGANTDCKPVHLLQFAVMGAVFIELITKTKNPRVALLSIGEEKSKGNDLVLATHYLLENSGLNFIGNVEGRDLMMGKADVVVCDGFVGNIVLKFAESLNEILVGRLSGPNGSLQGLPEKIKQLQKDFDPSEIGGVPLLGINGISMICHGGSPAKAIKNAIREAMMLHKGNLPLMLSEGIEQYDASMFARGMARIHGYQDKRDELEIKDNKND